AFQENYSGGVTDGIIIKFDSSGNRIWGTYYGGEGHDYLYSSACLQPFLYVSGNGNSANGISTPGSYQALLGGSDDGYLIKFNICPVPENSGPISGNNSICVPGTGFIYSIPAIPSATGYHWTVPSGATIISGNNSNSITVDFSPSAVSGNISVYGTNYCGSGDSSFIPVTIIPAEIINVSISASNNNVCAGTSITFTATPTNPGTSPVYQWKVNGINSGTNSTSFIYTPLNNDVVTCELTSSLTVCISNNPATSNSISMVVNPVLPVTVGVSASANPVCSGTTVNFTAIPVNGGSTPVYQWSVNGLPVGTNNAVYSYVPLTGDVVTCTLTSDALCASGSPATSTPVTMTVDPNMPVSITISATSNPFCQGSTVLFNAVPTNGGTTPAYQWKVNGINAGSNNSSYSYIPNNSDVVSCVLNSNIACPIGNPANSNAITMIQNNTVPVSVSIAASSNPVCTGTSVTFTAMPINGGVGPVYQWKVNGINCGTNSTTFTYVPVNGDVITCTLMSNAACASGNPATSNSVTMTVNPNLPVSISVSASANPICAGTTVIFTAAATNGGSTPVYQWKVNGVNAGSNLSTFTYVPVAGDQVSCIMTSNATCPTGNPATSNVVLMTVNPNLPVSATIAASANPICSGFAVTFTAIPANGGTTPVYQWKVNGVNAGTNSSIYTYNPTYGDQVLCILTSNIVCPNGNPAISNTITMNVNSPPIVSLTSCFDTITTVGAKPFRLKGGIPLGGTYSGPGVNGMTGIFTPSVAGTGLKTISYTYTNVASCSAGKSKTILVQPNPVFTCGNSFSDIRDGKSYPTVQIGTQCWMAANLNRGTQITSSQVQFDNCTDEKYCFGNDAAKCSKYGGLYQWDEMMRYDDTPAGQGLCPPGWHIPTDNDWTMLFNFYNGNGFAGKPLQDTIISGFRAMTGGVFYLNSSWSFADFAVLFWTSSSWGSYKALSHGMNTINFSVSLYPSSRANAFPVRCLRD
ncbi:MAG: FISUMP domain-containing protein, partial [Bacteroidota bacterium]